MSREELQPFLRSLDPDEVADVLGLMDEKVREKTLRRLDEDRRKKVEFLLEFSPESAGGLMRLNYVSVDKGRDLDAVAERVRRYEEKTGEGQRN